MERIGVFGGSFDPIHMGHLTVAQDAIDQLKLDQLILIPAAISPHKQNRRLIDGTHRFNMLRLATINRPRLEVSDLELVRGGVSYTVDTISFLQTKHSQSKIFFIVGLDSLVHLHRWHRIENLLECCTMVPFGRGGEDLSIVAKQIQLSTYWKTKLLDQLIQIHEIKISSSDIRHRIANGSSIKTLVPPSVEMYLLKHHLYS